MGAGLGGAGAVFVLGMRARSPVVRDAVRRANRDVFNPQQMASADSAGSATAVVRVEAPERAGSSDSDGARR